MFITDFDGVVCDSVIECFLAAYNAYGKMQSASFQRELNLEATPFEKRKEFRRLRVYLKGAEDFVPLFMAMEQNIQLKSQDEFDRFRARHEAQFPEYVAAFYVERDFLLQNEKELWLSLNPLFDIVGKAFKQHESFEKLRVLTTKRQQDAYEIFQYNKIPFPKEHIFYIKADHKPVRLLELLKENDANVEETVYLEDQVDFLVASNKQGIGSYLVEWGYVSDEQKALARQNEIPIIAQEQYAELLGKFS